MPFISTLPARDAQSQSYWPPQPDHRLQTHRVIIEVVVRAGLVIAEQGRDLVQRPVSAGQRLINPVLHHRAGCIVAVMAAQAHQQTSCVRSRGIGGAWQRLCHYPVLTLAGVDNLSVQAGNILAPESEIARGRSLLSWRCRCRKRRCVVRDRPRSRDRS